MYSMLAVMLYMHPDFAAVEKEAVEDYEAHLRPQKFDNSSNRKDDKSGQ
jgi:hypothetical protein